MGYDILSKIIEITDSNDPFELRLKQAARFLTEKFPFDCCCIYRWNDKNKNFALTVSSGRKICKTVSTEEDGLLGIVKKRWKPLLAAPRRLKAGRRKEAENSIFYPLSDGAGFYGVLCLSSLKRTKLPERKKKLLDIITKQLSSMIKNEENLKRLEAMHNEVEDLHVRFTNAEKLMSLGELSATLAHEIKTPLVSIGGFAARLKKKLPPDFPHLPYVEQIVKEVARLEAITHDILHFAEDKTLRFKEEELSSLVEESLGFFEEAFNANHIKMKKEMSREPIPVMADPDRLKIAFDNLIANAIESMTNGGTVRVATKKNEEWGVFEISDTGGGIDPALVGNIFNPFFTTKKKGTGLGLPITHKIITRHNGLIHVENEYGKGMTFYVKLPLTGQY